MLLYRVHLEQQRCADIEVEAEDYADAREKALHLITDKQWCAGHHTEVIDIDIVLDDE